MEDPLVRQPSSGTIISHNAHLLLDPQENSENNGSFNRDDNGHDRPASDSSQLSREMDASPIDDEGRNSDESLDEEARYQKELKDRVRRSYADLGMEPEGILLKQEEEITPQDSININENLNYGKIKTAKRNVISNELIEEEQTGDEPPISSQEDGIQDDNVSPQGEYSKESVAVNKSFVKDVTDHQFQNNGINNVSDEYASADEVRNVNSAAGERRGEELSNNYKSDVPPYQSEHVTSPDAARSRLSRQSKIQDQEESEGNNISDGKNVLGLEDRVRDDSESVQTYANVVQDQGLVNHYSEQGHEYANDNSEDRGAAGVYGDGYANDVPEDTANEGEPHPGEDEYLRDSLEEDVPRDYKIGREQELRKGRRVDEEDAFRDSLEDQTQQVIPSRLENGIHGNVNNNAQPGGSPPVGSKSDRTHANLVQDQELVNDSSEEDDEYANDYREDRGAAGVYGDEYANEEDTANQGQSRHFHLDRREPQRSPENNAAHDHARAPPVPPPMPPEPPPPILRGKTPPGGVSSRPATNPFRIGSQQGVHQSLEYLPTHQQNQDALRENDQFQSKAAPAVEEHERPSAQGSQGKIVNLRNNPYHAEFLNHAAKEQPLSIQDLPQPVPPPPATNRRVHPPPPPPPQSQTFQDQNFIPETNQDFPPARQPIQSAEKILNQTSSDPSSRQLNPSQIPQDPRQELQLSKSPLRVRESPRQGISPSRTPLHLRQQEKSYLDQFRDKQRSSDGNRQGDPSDPGRISQHSNRNVQDRQEGHPNQASDRDLPVRTLQSQKGVQGYGRNSRGSGANEGSNASSQGQPQRNPKEANGSLASLESLRFQGLPRQDSHAKANNKEEKTIKTLPSGEMLHVAYISDDSDDEDMHFVDEMGNPVDTHGNLLTKSPSLKEDQPPKLEYRIKPTPPKQKSSSGVRSPSGVKQASSGGRTIGSGRALVNQTAQVPSAVSIRRQTTIDKAVGESKAPSPDVPAAEEFVSKTTAQMEGELSGTLPGTSATSKRPPSSGRRKTSENAQPFGNVTVASLQGQPQYGYPPNMNPGMQMAYQMPHQFVASQVPGQMVLANQPAIISPNASYSFAPQMYAQIQPTVAMSPVQTILQPVMQHPQVYMGGPSQFQPQFIPAQVQPGPNVYGVLQGEVGVSERSGPSQESQVTDKNLDEDEEEESPQEEEDVPPASEQRRGKHPKGVRGLLADRNKENRPKKTIPKAGKNFIDANKNNVKNLPREKKYKDLYGNVKTKKQPLNRKEPLPNISQDEEDSGEERWAYREDANGYREDEEWARRLVEEQRLMAALKRNQSDSNILDRHTGRRQGYDDPRGYGGGTYPPGENWKNADGQPYSYSADRAVTYARMQGPGNKAYKQNVSFKDVSMVPQDGGRSGPRERFAYTHPMPTSRYSPYDILPDIPGEENEQLRVSDPNGYLMKLHKQREPPNYKEYTVKDYRALKRDIRLGGLGPDPELVHERQEKAQRQREYAKAIMQQNKKSMKRPEKPWTPPNEKPQGQENSRRGAALRYAKNISRPPLRTPQEELHARIYGTNSRLKDDLQVRDGAKTYMVDEIAKLEELAERHRQEKEEIDRLRSGQAP